MELAARSDEQELVASLRAGDDAAFTALVDRHTSGLMRVARGHVGSRASAEEVVQETWLALLDGLDRFEERSSLQTWLYRVVLNRARSRGAFDARSVPMSALVDDPEHGPTVEPSRFLPQDAAQWRGHWSQPPRPWQRDPQVQWESAENLGVLRDAINALPERQRTVVVLRDVEGMGADEVADILALTPGNVRVLLHRGRAKLRQALEDQVR